MVDRSQSFQQLDEPQKRGQASEAVIKPGFTLRDIPVLVPEYDTEPCHIVVEISDRMCDIQYKTAYEDDRTVQFETVSTRTKCSGYDRSGYC